MGHPGRRAKNKSVSNVQITAEQILRDARNEGSSQVLPRLQAPLLDKDELSELFQQRRQAFEEQIRRSSGAALSIWAKYARWEEGVGDLRRATSVWERAASSHQRDPRMWINYAEMNMRHRLLNSARNVWERAIFLLPRHDQLWYKYIHMEDMLSNALHVRALFERWTCKWVPGYLVWFSFIKFELRHKEIERAREIFENLMCSSSSCAVAWIKYAKFEVKHGHGMEGARHVYERALEQLRKNEDEAGIGKLLLAFAQFEEMHRKPEQARCILKYGVRLGVCNNEDKEALQKALVTLEKRYANAESIEIAIIDKKRVDYEQIAASMPWNYDNWLDMAKLEASHEDENVEARIKRVCDVYKRAVAITPPSSQKRDWQRYIYLWINYALFEELEAKDSLKAQEVYMACLNLIPHHKFSFSKIWILASEVEIRRKNLKRARRILGNAIGRAPSHKLFRRYIEMEMALGNVDRCRVLHHKYVEWAPSSSSAWKCFAEMERHLGEKERARSVFELAAKQPVLDNPKALLDVYMNFEVAEEGGDPHHGQPNELGVKRSLSMLWNQEFPMEQRCDVIEDALFDVHGTYLKRSRCCEVSHNYTKFDYSKVLQAAHRWKEEQKSEQTLYKMMTG